MHKRQGIQVLCVTMLAVSCSRWAEAAPKDVAAILEEKEVPATKLRFEMVQREQSLGYHVSSLTPAEGESFAYNYRAESVLEFHDGLRIDSVVIAHLKKNFEPIDIMLDRSYSRPQVGSRQAVDRAIIRDNDILLIREPNEIRSASERTVPKPKEAFVFGMEFVIGLLDVAKNPTIPIAELNPQEGTASVYRVLMGPKSGSTQPLLLQKSDGAVGYRFELNDKGHVQTWAEGTAPVTLRLCDEERFKEVQEEIETR